MAVSDDRKYTKEFVYNLLESVKGKTLGEVDSSNQFARTEKSDKITGIAGDVIEQSVFKYKRDSKQECDIEIDGVLTELKTTGVRIPKSSLSQVKGKTGDAYNIYLKAKEGISITGVTFEPTIQTDFLSSHFWEKAEHLLIVFYEYKPYTSVSASAYMDFPIVDYCYNTFSETEKKQLRSDWEYVSKYLQNVYNSYTDKNQRDEYLVGFTHKLRSNLLLIELVPGFKKKGNSYQKPRYRLKKTFVDCIVEGHFNKSRHSTEINLKESFSSFAELDERCHKLGLKYKGKTFSELKVLLGIKTDVTTKDFAAKCILRMFDADCNKLNEILDFKKAGIIAKTITLNPKGGRTEDMKLKHIDFDEWADRNIEFSESDIYNYFCEHSFLCPVFQESGDSLDCEIEKTRFEGFKRISFDDEFIEGTVRRVWNDSRALIHRNELVWLYEYDKKTGEKILNKSGSYKGSPNFPKSSEYEVFFRGGSSDSSEKAKTESVNGIKMLPQFFWLKGTYIVDKLKNTPFL